VRRLLALCIVAVGELVGCSRATAPPPNVLLVVIDTLRADRLGTYGGTRGLTPFLDSLAGGAYVFHQAYAQSSWTNPSVASVLTSRFPSQHGVVKFDSRLADSEISVAEVLKDHGYACGAFLANGLLASRFGFAQGFDEFRALWPAPPQPPQTVEQKYRADAINALAFAWLDQVADARKPVFLYLHYIEPHPPYTPPEAILDRLLHGRPRPDLGDVSKAMFFAQVAPPDAQMLQQIEDVYDAEVTSLDGGLRELFAGLERRGFLGNTFVAITADHGEEFNDHGLVGHGTTLYNELIRVPLIVRLPRQTRRVDVDDVVSLVDIAPTMLSTVGVAAPPAFEGRALRPASGWSWSRLWRHEETPPAFSELIIPERSEAKNVRPHERAIVLGSQKLIVGPGGETELYDLASDPGEHRAAAPPAATRATLDRALAQFGTRMAHEGSAGASVPLDEEARARLKALGYVR